MFIDNPLDLPLLMRPDLRRTSIRIGGDLLYRLLGGPMSDQELEAALHAVIGARPIEEDGRFNQFRADCARIVSARLSNTLGAGGSEGDDAQVSVEVEWRVVYDLAMKAYGGDEEGKRKIAVDKLEANALAGGWLKVDSPDMKAELWGKGADGLRRRVIAAASGWIPVVDRSGVLRCGGVRFVSLASIRALRQELDAQVERLRQCAVIRPYAFPPDVHDRARQTFAWLFGDGPLPEDVGPDDHGLVARAWTEQRWLLPLATAHVTRFLVTGLANPLHGI
jgi:hypothetical protein